jgi:2-methylfumaryl-CoA hydratase
MNKGSVENHFEDFRIGQCFKCPTPRALSDADRVAYISYTGDRTPRFCNSSGLIHPLIVFHTVLGQTVRQISLNARANLGYAELIFGMPVHIGDEIHTTAQVIGLKENSNGTTGIVYVRTTGQNQRDEAVLEYVRWVMVKKKERKETQYLSAPSVPRLASSVRCDRLRIETHEDCCTMVTGGTLYFGDYDIGERIFHVDGMTINSSDHMCFTRLFQNSARVHFDNQLTNGRPLVYGGLPLSIGYALSYNGMENRLGIVAINGGTHANPVYPGDTLYAFTDVIDKMDLPGTYGALRLRLLVVKNEQPEATATFHIKTPDPQATKEGYNKNVVLDLDYWDMIAKGE